MIKIKEELLGIGLTNEQVYEVIRRFEKHFHLTELEMDAGDISVKCGKGCHSTDVCVLCHGKQMNHILQCDIRIRGGKPTAIILEIV